MFRRKSKQHARERATEYATCKDFQQIFTEDMVGLHRLAFLADGGPRQGRTMFCCRPGGEYPRQPCFPSVGACVEQAGHHSECNQDDCACAAQE